MMDVKLKAQHLLARDSDHDCKEMMGVLLGSMAEMPVVPANRYRISSGRLDRPIRQISTIEALFERWKDAEARENAADTDEEADPIHMEYNALREQLIKEVPTTARELAMILVATTDRWACETHKSLEHSIDRLAGEVRD